MLIIKKGGTFNPLFNSNFRNLDDFLYALANRINVGMIVGCFIIHGMYILENMGNFMLHGTKTLNILLKIRPKMLIFFKECTSGLLVFNIYITKSFYNILT